MFHSYLLSIALLTHEITVYNSINYSLYILVDEIILPLTGGLVLGPVMKQIIVF